MSKQNPKELFPGLEMITITVIFDKRLQKITRLDSYEAPSSKGLLFIQFLHFLFQSYPEIPKRYPPGMIGITVNGLRPRTESVLHDGDVISLTVAESKVN